MSYSGLDKMLTKFGCPEGEAFVCSGEVVLADGIHMRLIRRCNFRCSEFLNIILLEPSTQTYCQSGNISTIVPVCVHFKLSFCEFWILL